MNQFFEKYPWLKSVGCGVLVVALVLSICLPLMGMRSAEPENPILQAEPQEITVLQAGKAPGGAGSGDGVETSGSGANGDAESDLTGDVEQPDPEETNTESGQDSESNTVPQDQPTQPDYSEASIGTNTDSNQSDDGEEAGETGEADEDLPLAPLDLGAALTWYKYGSEPTSIVCAPGQSVGKRVLLAQLDNGSLPYSLDLTGLDAQDAVVTGAFFASGNEIEIPIDTRGAVPMSLPDGTEYQNYVFIVQATATQKNQKGETVKTAVQFTFLLRLESGIDLDLQMSWQTLTAPAQATCFANSSVSRTIKGDTIQDGLFQYDFSFLGESAREAEFVSVDYRATDGETGTLDQSGTLQMAPADGQDTETYSITVTARVSGQTIRYNFVLTYEDGLDLQLQFTWYEKSTTRREELCNADKRVNLTVKHNQLQNGELLYKFGLKGKSASDAQIISAAIDGTALNTEKGSYQLQSAENGATYTILVTAKVKEKNVTFTVTLRYQSDVSLQMTYTLTDPDTKATIPNSLTCENGKTTTAEPIYDDQLTDGLLTYQFSIQGEDAANVTISSAKCYQTGSGRTETLTASGSVTLLLKDNKTGGNTFTVTAASGSETYTFTFDLPYKHRGENKVIITANLKDGAEVTNEEPVNLTVEAWSEDAQGNRTHILANGVGTKLTVTLDGATCRMTSQSGTTQQYVLVPENPKTGDRNEHILVIYAEDELGNYGEKTIHFIGKRTEEGQKIGTATVYIDAGVVGGGILGPISYDVLSGERVSYSMAKAVWDYDAGEPFGTARESFFLPENRCLYNGSFDSGFYLRELPLSGSSAVTLSGSWRDYGSTDAEILTAIDARFGAGTALASFWRCIYRNGIELSDPGDGLGEYSYTMASGWLYSVGGSTFYPGNGMSDYYLKDGDVLTIRFTLAYGWDVCGSSDRGCSVGYCTQWTGDDWSVQHNFQKAKSGLYTCVSCGLEQACLHTNSHWKDLGDGTCIQVCDDENGREIGQPVRHDWAYTPAEDDEHTVKCKNCGLEESVPHSWQEVSGSNTATCTEPGEKTLRCADCGTEKKEASEPLGHQVHEWLMDGAETHYHFCQRCQQRVDEGTHSYVGDGQYYQCTVCGNWHDAVCTGTITATDNHDGLTHTISCSGCTLIHGTEPHDTLGLGGGCSVCGYMPHDCAANARDYHDNGDGTHTGTCNICGSSVKQVHTYENDICIYCNAPKPSESTEPTTPTDSEEGENQDE